MNQSPDPAKFVGRRKPIPRPWYRSRGWWLKQVHGWHWMSAALSLVGMLLFAITGITLNHAATIPASPTTEARTAQLAAPLLAQLAKPASDSAPLPAPVASEVEKQIGLDPAGKAGEWSDGEVYVAMPRPGGDAWVSIDRSSGAVSAEITDRGWISYVNDLHKGRHTGTAWAWFIDVFSVACVVFCLTGLALLYVHAKRRPKTWPIVAAGVLLPVIIIIFFVH